MRRVPVVACLTSGLLVFAASLLFLTRRILGTAFLRQSAALGFGVCLVGISALGLMAADHADTPFLIENGRPDARITGLHVFARGPEPQAIHWPAAGRHSSLVYRACV